MLSLNDLKEIFNQKRAKAQKDVSNLQDSIRREYLKELEEYTVPMKSQIPVWGGTRLAEGRKLSLEKGQNVMGTLSSRQIHKALCGYLHCAEAQGFSR